MFDNGAGELVLHFVTQCNTQLNETLAEQHNQVQLGQAEYVHVTCLQCYPVSLSGFLINSTHFFTCQLYVLEKRRLQSF